MVLSSEVSEFEEYLFDVKGRASIKMREIDPSHVKETIILPARW